MCLVSFILARRHRHSCIWNRNKDLNRRSQRLPVPKSEPDSDNSRKSGNSDSDSSRKSENIVHAGRGLRNAAELADVVEAAL